MFKQIACVLLILLSACAPTPIEELEKLVVKRAQEKPETAENYFIEQIESGATYEEQAVYVYGMGVASETQGNIAEAINNYIAAEALGSAAASRALQRLQTGGY